jgi:hypothetical protein
VGLQCHSPFGTAAEKLVCPRDRTPATLGDNVVLDQHIGVLETEHLVKVLPV